MYDNAAGQQNTIAGIESQMGVLYYMLGNYSESYNSFKNAVLKLRASGDKKLAFFGIALNQMGIACVRRYAINEALELFEEARTILEQEYGPYHVDTLGVYGNLTSTYVCFISSVIIYGSHILRSNLFSSILINFVLCNLIKWKKRLEDAIEIFELLVGMREEKLGTANPDVDDEKKRLIELLKEASRVRNRKARSLENLFDSNNRTNTLKNDGIKV
ncbi:hypothetical protein ACH5RR_008875 [Cinchona calisaya]|uniref:Kinesin light chain n=1 Tax=Cinchona calisaya TaxID=153742 RepID=A0ABD3AEH4_9GENT